MSGRVPVPQIQRVSNFDESYNGQHIELPSLWINILSPSTNGTAPGFVNIPGSIQFWGISMYHQLHCLVGLERILNNVFNNDELGRRDAAHARHCVDYISQASLCAADATLEPITTDPPGQNNLLAAKMGSHMCKDWRGVRDWVEENSAG